MSVNEFLEIIQRPNILNTNGAMRIVDSEIFIFLVENFDHFQKNSSWDTEKLKKVLKKIGNIFNQKRNIFQLQIGVMIL